MRQNSAVSEKQTSKLKEVSYLKVKPLASLSMKYSYSSKEGSQGALSGLALGSSSVYFCSLLGSMGAGQEGPGLF